MAKNCHKLDVTHKNYGKALELTVVTYNVQREDFISEKTILKK